jgi:hypothetical protein
MLEFLRDPVWQFVGAVFAILAVAVAIFLYLRQRQRKELSYEFVYRAPLVSIEESVKGRVKILLDDKPVQDICLVAVRILNSGNLPIIPADYERQVSLCFSENTQVISAEVSETKPKSLQATVSVENTKVVLAPVLLNSGDSITLKMLVNQFDGQISVYGHIVGVKDIKELERPSRGSPWMLIVYWVLPMVVLVSIIPIVITTPLTLAPPGSISAWDPPVKILLMILIALIALIGWMMYVAERVMRGVRRD